MDRQAIILLGLVILSSGCMGAQQDSEGFLSEFDSNELQLESPGQETKFVLDMEREEYRFQTSSPQSAEEMFSDSENRTSLMRSTCSTLQERTYELGLDQRVEGHREFDVLNQNGGLLESEKSINQTKLANELESYELSQVKYTVSNESGEEVAMCIIKNKEPEGLEISLK